MRRLGLLCPVAALAVLAGCTNDTRDLAPASPDTPWQGESSSSLRDQPVTSAVATSSSPRFATPRDSGLPWPDVFPEIDPDDTYTLTELIDLAQRTNKQTRVAWEAARQAAIAVGISRAAYLPELTATVLAGYQHVASPFPSSLVAKGYITADAEEAFPELAMRYLLLDFGRRDALTEQARQISFAANVLFTAVHQKLILDVSRAYFLLDGVNAQLAAARQSLSNAQLLQQSAETMYARGLSTIVNVQLARRSTAQSIYDIAAATSAQHEAMYGLLEAIGLPPTVKLRVQDSAARPLPRVSKVTIDLVLHDALAARPDLLADLAKLRAADAGLAFAHADMKPQVSITANIQGNIGRIAVDGGPYEGVTEPQTGVFLHFDWPLYQGGELRNKLRLAESKRAEAEDTLQEDDEEAMRQVAMAVDELDTSLQQYDAACALQTASEAAFDGASRAFANGVGTLTDAMTTQTTLAAARASLARAHAQTLVDAAALAFATGQLTSAASPALQPEQAP